eukprot:CAMPEP_0119038854 /NCGR_PEP_ID=MMETSP1177-20130426/8022_1 /TAXON_ID=2985 /ORGANISM="Ochromonas sp, Strain CCMP1899" /LENGTH=198 /DNA_ID=CAMNT_0007001967 /DNA_START=91 /DNA_END=684 /DNA_ORIENTATION=+
MSDNESERMEVKEETRSVSRSPERSPRESKSEDRKKTVEKDDDKDDIDDKDDRDGNRNDDKDDDRRRDSSGDRRGGDRDRDDDRDGDRGDRDGDRPRRVDNRPEDVNRGSTSLLVRNLAYDVRSDEIKRMMEEFGDVRDVYIPQDYHTRKPRGFAFVEFYHAGDAADAHDKLDNAKLAGREIAIVFAKDKRKTPGEMR